MSHDQRVRQIIATFADTLDDCLAAEGSEILTRIVIMQTRDKLRRYDGLHNVVPIRKAIERLPAQLADAGFPVELLGPVQVTCSRLARLLRRA